MTKTYDFKRILITKEKTIKTCFDLCTRQIEKPDNSLHYISKTPVEVDKANAFKVFNSEIELGLWWDQVRTSLGSVSDYVGIKLGSV